MGDGEGAEDRVSTLDDDADELMPVAWENVKMPAEVAPREDKVADEREDELAQDAAPADEPVDDAAPANVEGPAVALVENVAVRGTGDSV